MEKLRAFEAALGESQQSQSSWQRGGRGEKTFGEAMVQ